MALAEIILRLGRADAAAAEGTAFGAERTRPVGSAMGVGRTVAERAGGRPAPCGAGHRAVTQAPGATRIGADRAGILAVLTAALPREAGSIQAKPPRPTLAVSAADGKGEAVA